MNELDDSVLLQALASGDRFAFDQLMRRHGKTVYRYAWAVVDTADQVEDAVQDTFLTLWRRRKHLTLVDDSVLPWLLATCRYMALNSNRRHRKSRTVPLDSVEHTHASVDASSGLDELRWVREELASLSVRDRRLVETCILQGKTYEVAARELGVSAPTARKRMQRVRDRLRAAKLREES